MISDMLKVSAVYDLSAVHNKDAVCYFGDGSQVMGDEKHGSIFILFNADKLFQVSRFAQNVTELRAKRN